MKLTYGVVAAVLLTVTFTVAFEPSSQMAFNIFLLKKFGPIQSVATVVSLSDKPSSVFVPISSVSTKNGRSVLTLVKSKGLFALEYTNLVVQLGEPQGDLVEIVSPKLESNSKLVSFRKSIN